jgi:predicted amidohydrolase
MRICAAQFRPVAGNIAINLAKHLELIDLAVAHRADLAYFPELSLTGYEPRLAKSLATNEGDSRLDRLQERSNAHSILVGVGLPITFESSVLIGMIWFSPKGPRRSYAKQQLHADELSFFVCGEGQLLLEAGAHTLAPAICYESLAPNHSDNAAKLGADIYLTSVAPHVHSLCDCKQEFVDVPERVHTVALLIQVAKKGTPLFCETAHLVSPYPIAALHHLVEHLADSLE